MTVKTALMLMLFGYSDNILSCIHCNLYSKNINPCENTVNCL